MGRRPTWMVTEESDELLHSPYTKNNLVKMRSSGVSYDDALYYLINVRNVPPSIAKRCITRPVDKFTDWNESTVRGS